jgi:hypothetical protein
MQPRRAGNRNVPSGFVTASNAALVTVIRTLDESALMHERRCPEIHTQRELMVRPKRPELPCELWDRQSGFRLAAPPPRDATPAVRGMP